MGSWFWRGPQILCLRNTNSVTSHPILNQFSTHTISCWIFEEKLVLDISDIPLSENRMRKVEPKSCTVTPPLAHHLISVFFIIFNIPREFDHTFWPNASEEVQANWGFKTLSLELCEPFVEGLAYSSNFFLYVCSCGKFRDTLKEILGCKCQLPGSNVRNSGTETKIVSFQ